MPKRGRRRSQSSSKSDAASPKDSWGRRVNNHRKRDPSQAEIAAMLQEFDAIRLAKMREGMNRVPGLMVVAEYERRHGERQ